MKINLETLSILSYEDSDKHYKFVEELSNDTMIKEYVPCDIKRFIISSKDDTDIERNSAYIISDKEKLIGFIQIFSIFNDTYLLNYGVHLKYRKQGYGTKILKEFSNYLISEKNKKTRISISESNKYSLKAANSAGYELEEVIAGTNYIYEKRK